MKIKFCGAAETVTGSCHLLTLDDGYTILLDCGLYQGHEDQFEDFNTKWPFEPSRIDVLVLSHAHIDHCGRIPKFVADGFTGSIICTHATLDLSSIMLMDSAHIQEKDAEYDNKKRGRDTKPLYTSQQAKDCLRQFVSIGYDKWYNIKQGIEVFFADAGHLLGSASVTLKINVDEKETFFGFSGDIGRPNRPILKDPEKMPHLDYLICESTYGGEKHPDEPHSDGHFLNIIQETCVNKGGKVIIPAFSVGRTQEIVYVLDQMYNKGLLPKIPVYVDSPLAVNATEVFKMHPECFDDDIYNYMLHDTDPFGFNSLQYITEVEESKALNFLEGPAVIISASGMANAGRIKHHIANNIENPKNTILIVGYCADGTLGEQLVKKPEMVKIFGQEFHVRANIEVISSLSAHGDHYEMLTFLEHLDRKKLKNIFLVHGEPKRQQRFKEGLLSSNFNNVEIPHLHQEFNL